MYPKTWYLFDYGPHLFQSTELYLTVCGICEYFSMSLPRSANSNQPSKKKGASPTTSWLINSPISSIPVVLMSKKAMKPASLNGAAALPRPHHRESMYSPSVNAVSSSTTRVHFCQNPVSSLAQVRIRHRGQRERWPRQRHITQ